MKYMLDTNICSYIIKYKPAEVREKFNSINMEDCYISAITLAELKYWVGRHRKLHEKSKNQNTPKINEQIINNFINHLMIIEFDEQAAEVYGDIRAELESKGKIIGNADLFIGAHAVSLNATLVTNNIKHFKDIPKIRLENWVSSN